MNEKMSFSEVSLHTVVSGEERASGTPSAGRALIMLSLLVLVLAIVTSRVPALDRGIGTALLGNSAVVEMDFSGVADDYAFYTERYWNAAEARIVPAPVAEPEYAFYTERYWNRAETAAAAPVAEVEDYAYYTERYWNMAAPQEASAAGGTVVVDDYAYYTERYWDMAATGQAIEAESSEDEGFAYYTERYWNRAGDDVAGVGSGEKPYAYYTERYWQQAQER